MVEHYVLIWYICPSSRVLLQNVLCSLSLFSIAIIIVIIISKEIRVKIICISVK